MSRRRFDAVNRGSLRVYGPLRAVANGDGSEVSLTLFQRPGMDDARFAADIDWV